MIAYASGSRSRVRVSVLRYCGPSTYRRGGGTWTPLPDVFECEILEHGIPFVPPGTILRFDGSSLTLARDPSLDSRLDRNPVTL